MPAICNPVPCLIDQAGMVLYVVSMHRPNIAKGFQLQHGLYPVAVMVRWEYEGSGSRSPQPDQVSLIGADRFVVGRFVDGTGGIPECTDYDTPEMATGANFGPRPICFLLGVPPAKPLTLRWQHGIFGGADQDLVLS